MNPLEIFKLCVSCVMMNLDREAPDYRQASGELLGASVACGYMEGADKHAINDALNDALASLRVEVVRRGGTYGGGLMRRMV